MGISLGRQILASAVLLALAATGARAEADVGWPAIFGAREVRAFALTMFPRWQDALDRYDADQSDCAATGCTRPRWHALLPAVRELDPMGQLTEVNRQLNEQHYLEDADHWGERDYWATPPEFLAGGGDCEDYAVAKYMALRASDWPAAALRIVVLRDLRTDEIHAVLAVHLGGRALVLDNRYDRILPTERIDRYQPIYSVNEDGGWLLRTGGDGA